MLVKPFIKMKKKQFLKKLSLQKIQISLLKSNTISGGITATNCCPERFTFVLTCELTCNRTDYCTENC